MSELNDTGLPSAASDRFRGQNKRWVRKLGYLGGAINSVFFRTPLGRWVQRRQIAALQFSEVEVPLARGGAALDGLKLAFLSDLHAGSCLREEHLVDLARRVAAWEPDVLCLGGDLIDTRLEELELYREALRMLETPLGRFAVPGNHEYYRFEFPPRWASWLEDEGVRVLWNRGERLERDGATLWLGGVDDLTEGKPDAAAALDGRDPEEPAVLLSHHPDVFLEAARLGADLQISGHTHGGQVRFFGRAPIVHSDHGFLDGMHRRGESRLYVGRGIGVTAMPLRIGVPGEVVLVRLRTRINGSS